MAKKPTPPKTGRTDAGTADAGVPPTAGTPYVVLARKYRPESFADLIGQDAMVTTLRNAFAAERIAQGYMLTGVRGVGKTTTARILARALNYEADGIDRPTVDLDAYGRHCADIIASRHPDVVEMDAASNTGVDNMREIIESARYKPMLARTKVYIIDEVHMLSKGAFNALLKTLEEPPPHVKFIFATTEIRKVPVTIISRCQRFDLKRIEVPVLVAHFERILAKENATAEPDALRLIARAAEGSVRDGLSILDQAIAMGSGAVTTTGVREMLGLADRGRIFDLLELVVTGKSGPALQALDGLYRDGADPIQALTDLAEAVHATTRLRVAGVAAASESLASEEKRRAATLAERLSMPLLTRFWQMLLKGIEEAEKAPDPRAAADMVLIRLAYTADLPAPDEIIRSLGAGGATTTRGGAPQTPQRPAPQAPLNATPSPAPAFPPREPSRAVSATSASVGPQSFDEVAELAGRLRDARLKVHLEEDVRLVRFEPGHLELRLLDTAPSNLANELGEKLSKWTNRRWVIAVSRERGEATLGEVRRAREAAEIEVLKAHPTVEAVLKAFPDAEIKGVRPLSRASEPDDESAAG
jgi:DNA polymerase-3 subunit gamma/tau